MAIREVLQLGDPRLREVCSPVEVFDAPEIIQLRQDLADTLADLQFIHGRGGGLAAPQIGAPLRLFHINARGRSFFLHNPRIVERSEELFEVWDFCFSARAAFLAPVSRHFRITVDYQDERGTAHEESFEDYFSELLQHELDHLDGTLFIDRITDPERITMVEAWDEMRMEDEE